MTENKPNSLTDIKFSRRRFLQAAGVALAANAVAQIPEPLQAAPADPEALPQSIEWNIDFVQGEPAGGQREIIMRQPLESILDSIRQVTANPHLNSRDSAAGNDIGDLPYQSLIKLERDVEDPDTNDWHVVKEVRTTTDPESGDLALELSSEEVYTAVNLTEKVSVDQSGNINFVDQTGRSVSLPVTANVTSKELQDVKLPEVKSTASLAITDLFEGVGGGALETELEADARAAWETSESDSKESEDITAYKRAVFTSAVGVLSEKNGSGVFDIGTILGKQPLSLFVNVENETVDVISAMKKDAQTIFAIARGSFKDAETIEDLNPSFSSIGFTTIEGLVSAYGVERATEMVNSITALDGNNVSSLAEGLNKDTHAKIFLPGMPRNSQFLNKIAVQEGNKASYTRVGEGTYQAIETSSEGEVKSAVASRDTEEWVVIPSFTQEVAQAAGTSNTSEAPLEIQVSEYGNEDKGYTVWVNDPQTGEGRYKANKASRGEWVWNTPGLGDYLKSKYGIDFGIAVHNRGNNLGKKEDTSIIVKDANMIVTEEAGEFRYMHVRPVKYENGKWDYEDISEVMDWSRLDQVVNFAKDAGKEVFFHHLIEAASERMPAWLMGQVSADRKALATEPNNSELRAQIREKYLTFGKDRIRAIMNRYKGTINQYVLGNEFLPGYDSPNDWEDTHREPNFWEDLVNTDEVDYLAEFSKVAAEVDPNAELVLNDIRQDFPQYISKMIERANTIRNAGGKVDTIGLQFHTSIRDTRISQAVLEGIFSQIAEAGYQTRLTELDWMHVNTEQDESYKAQMAQWIVRAAKSVNRRYGETVVAGIHMWGYRDDDSWLHKVLPSEAGNSPLLYENTADGLKPGKVYDAFLKEAIS